MLPQPNVCSFQKLSRLLYKETTYVLGKKKSIKKGKYLKEGKNVVFTFDTCKRVCN